MGRQKEKEAVRTNNKKTIVSAGNYFNILTKLLFVILALFAFDIPTVHAETQVIPFGTRIYVRSIGEARCLSKNYWYDFLPPVKYDPDFQGERYIFFSKADIFSYLEEKAKKAHALDIKITPCGGWTNWYGYNKVGYDFEAFDYAWKMKGYNDWHQVIYTWEHTTVRGITLGRKPNCKANEKLENGKCVPNGPTAAEVRNKVASLGSPGPMCTGIGDPCNASSGNQYETETDYSGPDFSFIRSYNSLDDRKTELGYGWTSSYHHGVEKVGDFLVLRSGDGKGNVVEKVNGIWTADADAKFTLVQTASGFAVSYNDGRSEAYGSDGHLLSETDKAGRTTTYTYSGGKLASVTAPFGQTLSFTYNSDGLLATMTDPAGQVTNYSYDANSNLVGVQHPDGSSRTYHYENASFKHALTGITDENGDRFLNVGYDSEGLSVMNEHAGGQEHFDLQYDSDTQTTITDAAGTVEVMSLSKNLGIKLPVQVLNQSDGKSIYRTFDANNNLTGRTGAEGRTTTYTYNAHNQRTSMTEAAGTPEARTTTYQYLSDDINLPTLVTSPSILVGQSKTTATTYANNLPVTITQSGYRPDGTAINRTVAMSYTPSGQVATIDGPRTDVNDVTTMTYYDCSSGGGCGQLKSVTNAQGQTTTYDSYDANGRVTQITSANGLGTSYTYDVRGRVLSTTQSDGSENHVTAYTYDPVGQLKTATDAGGRVLTYFYNAAHELIQVDDNLGNRVRYAYDSRGNRTATQTLDPDGTLVRSIETTYDARNRAMTVNAGGSITQRVFDAAGNLISETDPNNNPATNYSNDALDRLLQTVDRMGGTTAYQYNTADRLKQVSAPNGATTQYVYDDLGNQLSETSSDRGTPTMAYDSAGNLVQRTDARGVTATLSYDALNRVTKIDYPGDTDDVTYTYDNCDHGIGRLCKVSDASGTTAYAYTGFGNTAKQVWSTGSQSFSTSYTYDAANRLHMMTYPDGRVVTYSRDTLGRITNVAMTRDGNTRHLSSDRHYRADGLLTAQTFGNGLTESRSYDLQGRLTQVTTGSNSRGYLYDANGNVLGIISYTQNSSYHYDALDRVTSDQWIDDRISRALTFGYDANGNRTTLSANGATTDYSYIANSNRLSMLGKHAIKLDAMGNTLSDGKRRFEYNASGRLVALYMGHRLRATYEYNAQGLRTQKRCTHGHERRIRDKHDKNHGERVGSGCVGTTLYHYDLNGQLIAETTRHGEPIRTYVWVDGRPIVQATSDNHYGEGRANGKDKQSNWLHRWFHEAPKESLVYLQTDHLGTPRTATDAEGKLIWRWDGNAFGNSAPVRIVGNEGHGNHGQHKDDDRGHRGKGNKRIKAIPDRSFIALRFPGQYYDAESGLNYNWNRYYDPKTGRYITSDPIGLNGGLNTYGYAVSNPVAFTDPSGFNAFAGPGIAAYQSNSMSGDWSTAMGMTSDWATGSGPDTRTFGPGSGPVNDMKNAPGVDAARDYYNQKNKDSKDCDCKNAKAVTNYAAKFGASGYLSAGLNPTQQFVGSYRIDIYPMPKCKKLFVLTNTSSFKSLTYGVGPDWSRSSFGPGGNMTQYYWWIE